VTFKQEIEAGVEYYTQGHTTFLKACHRHTQNLQFSEMDWWTSLFVIKHLQEFEALR